jgi:hypothetical protein
MELLDNVKEICNRLAPFGWKELFLVHGLDITSSNLKEELLRELPDINRNIKGFEDFAFEGKRGIEPYDPARSLLYHAFASPNVTKDINENDLEEFPTFYELEVIENYVYGIRPLSIQELKAKAKEIAESSTNSKNDLVPFLAIVVFSSDYRIAQDTVHKKHADISFSRTAISRIGTKDLFYDGSKRGFLPIEDDHNDNRFNDFNVLPAKFSPYIALQLFGDKELFGPMNTAMVKGDEDRTFWIPLYKLFDGTECIKGLDLHVSLKSFHINDKIKRIHEYFENNPAYPNYPKVNSDSLNSFPYTLRHEIAEFSTDIKKYGKGLLVPITHPKLVEFAENNGTKISLYIPSNLQDEQLFSSSLGLENQSNVPEYVHIRHKITENNSIEDLNERENLIEKLLEGNYYAQHYIDFTGDGWVEAQCSELQIELGRSIPAYSIVAPLDFFHSVDQHELMDWYVTMLQSEFQNAYWIRRNPITNELERNLIEPLSNERFSANIELNSTPEGSLDPQFPFRSEDKTITSIISLPRKQPIKMMSFEILETGRHVFLPDAASGVFAPGWDIGLDASKKNGNPDHLALYTLGSPFPEDTKLCAALSSFWPSVSPDIGRSFWWGDRRGVYSSVSPLTDEENGSLGGSSWDGSLGPIFDESTNIAKYKKVEYVDYVQHSLDKKFSLRETIKIDLTEYKARILAIARVYTVLGMPPSNPNSSRLHASNPVLSFRNISVNDNELNKAQNITNQKLEGKIYRITIGNNSQIHNKNNNNNIKEIVIKFDNKITCFVGNSRTILIKHNNNEWQSRTTI